MEITKQNVYNALMVVVDPLSKQGILSKNMLKTIEVNGPQVKLEVELSPSHTKLNELELKEAIIQEVHKAVSENIVFDISFPRTAAPTAPPIPKLEYAKNIIAVASGKGGVGKSTVTANLAVSLAAQGYKVGLIDADIFGPSMPTMFGVEDEKPKVIQHEGRERVVPIRKHGVQLISIGFFAPGDAAVVWRGPMASKALKQFFSDCDWDDLDYLLLDLPPGTSDIHLTLVQTVPVTGAVIVTTPQKVALADAKKAITMFRQPSINVPVLGVVENMSYFTPEELPDNKYYIFGEGGGKELAEKYELNVLGQIPIVQSIRESGDNGTPEAISEKSITFNAFKSLAEQVVQQTEKRNAEQPPTDIVEITRTK